MTSSTEAFSPLTVPRLEGPAARPLFTLVERVEHDPAGPRLPDWANGGPEHEAEQRATLATHWQGGFDEGRALGEAEATTRQAPALEALHAVVAHLSAIADTFARDQERNLHALATAIARGVIQRELAADPAWVETLVRRAIERLPHDPEFTIRLHPDDLAVLGSDLERLAPEGRQLIMTWMADDTIEHGGFVVESPQRLIDGRADVALRVLYERLDHD